MPLNPRIKYRSCVTKFQQSAQVEEIRTQPHDMNPPTKSTTHSSNQSLIHGLAWGCVLSFSKTLHGNPLAGRKKKQTWDASCSGCLENRNGAGVGSGAGIAIYCSIYYNKYIFSDLGQGPVVIHRTQKPIVRSRVSGGVLSSVGSGETPWGRSVETLKEDVKYHNRK